MSISTDPITKQVDAFERQLKQAFKTAGIGIHGRIGRGLPEGDSQLFYSVSGFGQRAKKGSLEDRYIGGINIGLALYVPDPRHNDEAIRTAEVTVNRLEWTVETPPHHFRSDVGDMGRLVYLP